MFGSRDSLLKMKFPIPIIASWPNFFTNFDNVFASNASSTGSSLKLFGVLKRPRTVENENGQGIDHSPITTRDMMPGFLLVKKTNLTGI